MKKTSKQMNSQQPSTVRNTRSLTFEERVLVVPLVGNDDLSGLSTVGNLVYPT